MHTILFLSLIFPLASTPEGGPIPTTINFSKNPLIILKGKPAEVGKLQQKHEPLFGVDVKQYSNDLDFVQTVQVKGTVKTVVAGSVTFMVCNDKECLPPAKNEFSLSLN